MNCRHLEKIHPLIDWSIDWLIDRLIDCFTDELSLPLIDWSIDWSLYRWTIPSIVRLIDWLIYRWVTPFILWLIDWLIDWLIYWWVTPFIPSFIDWSIDWLIDWFTDGLPLPLFDWLIDCLITAQNPTVAVIGLLVIRKKGSINALTHSILKSARRFVLLVNVVSSKSSALHAAVAAVQFPGAEIVIARLFIVVDGFIIAASEHTIIERKLTLVR